MLNYVAKGAWGVMGLWLLVCMTTYYLMVRSLVQCLGGACHAVCVCHKMCSVQMKGGLSTSTREAGGGLWCYVRTYLDNG